MRDAEDPPRDANQPSQNDVLVDPEEDQHYYGKLRTHIQTFLPFLTEVINNSELLDIIPDRVSKLRYFYELVDAKRLSPDQLKTCKQLFYDLYDNYSKRLNYYLPSDFKTTWMQEKKLNDEENNVSSEVRFISNKSNQNQNSEFELSNKIPVPSTNYEKIVSNQMDCFEDLPPNNENMINKNFENFEIGESSCNKNSINAPLLAKNDLLEFSDSRIKLNKIIGFITNAYIAKLNKSDASIPHTEFTTQTFDEMIKQKNNPVIYKDILKGINMDDIDVNHVKNLIDGIKKASCVEPIQPPPLPLSDLMDLGASRIKLISTTEPNSCEVTRDNVILSKSSTNIHVQLTTEMNKLHKIGPSNETKPKFISELKPGTLIDLENSKVVRASLHIESLRPVIKSNEKNTEVKTTLTDVSVPHDSKIRHTTILNSVKNVNPFNTPTSLVSNAQHTFPTNTKTPFALNRDNSNAKLFDTRAQEIYNGQSSSSHTNIQLLNPQYSSGQNGNSIQLKNRSLSLNQNKHNRSDDKKNDYSQFSNSTQMHAKPSHIKRLTKYCDPVPYKSHSNDASKRDPRILKNVKTTVHPTYKKYREAKFREQIKGYVKNKKQMKQDHDQYQSLVNEKMEKSNIIDSFYNTFGPVNETANIKKFKIPKIKHNKECNNNNTARNSKLKTFGDNKNDTDVLTTEKKSKIRLKADTIKEPYLVNGQKSETNKSKISKKDIKITDYIIDSHMNKTSEIEITKNSSTDKDLRIKTIMVNNKSEKDSCPEINLEEITVDIPSKVIKEELDFKSEQNSILINPTDQSKPKKHKKYSKAQEFEKIIKAAAESLNDDVWGPKIRTRSSVMKKEGIINTIKGNNSKPKFKKDNTTKYYKKLESGECSKNLDNGSIPNLEDVSGRTEIGHNIISSTLKEQSTDFNSTTTKIVCKSQEKNIVSSNEINSTADNSPKFDGKALIDILKNPKFMTLISIFQDEDKLEKLNKLLESSDVNTNDAEKRKRRKINKSVSEESSIKESKNEYLNDISDNNFNQAENIIKTKKKNSHLNKFNEGNTSSGNINNHSSTDQHKLKSIKLKKSKGNYGNFEILKDKCKPETKDLNIVIAKFDKNIKRSDNCNPDISSSSNDESNSNKSVEQNSNTSTFIVNKPEIKNARLSDLDKLHADISEMFDYEAVLNAPNIRQCRTNKQIDDVSTKVVMSMKKKTSNIELLDSNDDQNEHDRSVGKTNNSKKKIKKSTIKLKTKKKFVRKSIANKKLPPLVVKTAVLNKISHKQQDKLKKRKKKNKKCMKFNPRQIKVESSDDFELNNVLKNNKSTEITFKIVPANKFKDKFYFQTADNSLECKFCNYKDKGLNIVRHYKDQHCEEEVLPSRLSKNCTESLIHQSLKENFGYSNSQDSKPICHRSVNVNYTCVFCQLIFHDYFKFYDHITGHTGEYRYKCKMCEQIFSNEDDLEKHILEHTEYDKAGGISHLIFPNPICSKYIFGYLCSFCYYVQLDYNNIVKHMASQHFDEDKKLNGHWTVIRISMSVEDTINTDSSIDFDNLVGCLPPIQLDQVISKSKDNEDQNQKLIIMDLNVLSNEQKQPNSILSIKKQSNDQNIDEISQGSNIDEYSLKSNIVENLPKSVTHANPPVAVYDKVLESTKLQFLPVQAIQTPKEGTRITTEPLAIEYSEYTLKEKTKKCVIAGLSCELINSMLIFKCSVSNCRENKFSTVVLTDFSKHIKKNHQFVVWDGHCEACHHKLPIVSEQYYVRNALEHLVSHHLVLKNNEQHPNTTANIGGSNIECLSSCQDTAKNTPFVKKFLKIRCLPGDKLSTHKPSSSSITNICEMSVNESCDDTNYNSKNDFIENNMFGNPEQSSHNILLGTQCQTSVNLNINHGPNDERFPLQITDVKSLNKGKVKTSKINSSASDNSDLNIWMNVKTNCEVIHPNSEIFLEEGQQIVNNGVPVDGTICYIDNGIVNLPVEAISVPEVLPQRPEKRSIECPDVLSVAMKPALIDKESQASDTIVITIPNSAQMAKSSTSMSLAIDNEFIMIDDMNQNDMQQTLKINSIWSESNNKEKEPKVSSNDDIIVIDDEDDVDLSEKEELNEGPTKQICLVTKESINRSNKAKRLAFPIIELDKLFVCKECAKMFSNGQMYFEHLNVCPFWDYVAGKKCIHCVKVYKTKFNMTEHVKLHGPDRFKCSLCNLKVPSQQAIRHHMRNSHKIIHLDFVPESPNLTDLNKDDFIVFENKKIEQKKQKMNSLFTCNKCSFNGNTLKIINSHMKAVHNEDCEDNLYKITPEQPNDTNNAVNSIMPQQNEQQNASLKRKRSTNFGNQKGFLKAKPTVKNQSKTLFFSPDTIDSIPKSHIFSDPISCLLCTFSTKVRSNLVIHLNRHTKGQDNTTKEIVNPVPSIRKCELMFDKMINFSASAFHGMNTEKIKRDEVDKKIFEVAPDDTLNTEIFPQFIPKNMRYKCSIAYCTYMGTTEDMLKKHISTIHPTHEYYICPHCLPPCIIFKLVEQNQIEFHLMHHGANLYRCQYCEYIDFNRVEMRTHMKNTHLSEITRSVRSNIIIIRQTMLEDDSIDRVRSKASSDVPQWVCNICSNSLIYTENEIKSHIFMAHEVSNMFKCPMCQFEHENDNANIFKEHFKLQHPTVAVKCLKVFEKISEKEEFHKQSKHLGGTKIMLKQQALESIEPTLVPPTCRGIPIESTPLKTYTNKSHGIAKRPKSATQSRKQKTFIDVFNKNDKLGAISSNGYFVCPICCVFETMNIKLFRQHLYKEVNYKTWKCLICFEISNSAKKMAWHVKKHGIGSKYEKNEDGEKLKWVFRVVGHQYNMLLTELNKNSEAKNVKSVESSKAIIVNSKRTFSSPAKKKNIEREKTAFVSQPNPDPVSNDDIIYLVDDSDDE